VFETIFPLAIWHDSDIMFLNGTKNFKTILYLGYNRPESVFGTDKFAVPFCEYYLSFMGLSLKPVNLMHRSAWKKIETIINSGGWTPPKLKKGMVFQNKDEKSYRLVNKIHSGKTAEIWKAEVLSDGTTVAVKFLSDKQFFYRFRREALTLKMLNETSQDVVKYHDFVFDPHPLSQALFIVMEYLTERSLKSLYQPGRLLMPDDIIMWLEKSLLAVLPFHRQEIVHRNITPDSLVFDKKDGIKLIDTGLSGYTEDRHPALHSDIPCAGEEEAVDAFEYASPEQLQHGKMGDEVTTKSDVFSLGASFYFIMTGQPPYGSKNAAAVAKNHTEAGISASSGNGVKPITEFFPECPSFLNDTILGMLHTDPYLRRDVSAVIADINTYRQDQKYEFENKNCHILPRMDDADVHFKGLMPTWLNSYMFRLWPVMLVLIWSFSAFLSINLDVFISIQPEAFSFIPANASVFPFFTDFVYTTWILMSFLFILILKRIVRSVQPIVKEIYTLDNNKDGEHWVASQNRNNRWSSFIHSKWLLMVVLAAAIFQCFTSIEKVQTSPVLNIFYWSDWRISWWGFASKVSVVFFNAIGVLYCLFSMAALIDLFSFILRGINPHLDMYNRDNQSGLMCIGKLLTLFLPIFLIFLYGLTIIMVIDFGKSRIHTFEHLAGIAILSFLYFFFILWPIFPVHKLIRVRRKTEQGLLQRRRNMIENRQKKYLMMHGDFDLSQADDFLNLSRLHEAILNQESTLQKLNTWPLNRTSFFILSVAGLSPLFFAVAFVSLKNMIV
jgi:serine/threonine protein kinase